MPQYQDYFGQAALRPQADIPRSLDQLYDLYLRRKQAKAQEAQTAQAGNLFALEQGFAPSDVTPQNIAQAQGPENLVESPTIAAMRDYISRKKGGRDLEKQKTEAEIAKLNAAASGVGDFYNVDQAAAILRDPIAAKTLSDSFGGRIPKGAISPAAAVGGREATLNKPASSDYTARGFADKAKQADAVLAGLVAKGFNPGSVKTGAQSLLPNVLTPEDVQSSTQALRQFVNAILRRESGAAIPPDELVNYRKQYWPESGDSDVVQKQKADARALAIRGLEDEAHKVPSALNGGTPPAPDIQTRKLKDGTTIRVRKMPDGSYEEVR